MCTRRAHGHVGPSLSSTAPSARRALAPPRKRISSALLSPNVQTGDTPGRDELGSAVVRSCPRGTARKSRVWIVQLTILVTFASGSRARDNDLAYLHSRAPTRGFESSLMCRSSALLKDKEQVHQAELRGRMPFRTTEECSSVRDKPGSFLLRKQADPAGGSLPGDPATCVCKNCGAQDHASRIVQREHVAKCLRESKEESCPVCLERFDLEFHEDTTARGAGLRGGASSQDKCSQRVIPRMLRACHHAFCVDCLQGIVRVAAEALKVAASAAVRGHAAPGGILPCPQCPLCREPFNECGVVGGIA